MLVQDYLDHFIAVDMYGTAVRVAVGHLGYM